MSVRKGEDQLANAQLAFRAAALAGMQPVLTCNGHPHVDVAEFDVVLGGRSLVGVLHEQIEQALTIATVHGGRLWLDTDGKLCIVWPITPGPGEPEDQPARVQASVPSRKPRAKAGAR